MSQFIEMQFQIDPKSIEKSRMRMVYVRGALHVASPDLTASAICHHKSFSQPRLQSSQSLDFQKPFGAFQGTFGALGELLELLRDLPDHILLVTVS